MKEREDVVVGVVAAAPGRQLMSRVRLQKTVYLLDVLGLGSGFSFEYHHYGPYSRELDNATAEAKAFNLIEERIAHRLSDGASYSIFAVQQGAEPKPGVYGSLGVERTRDMVTRFANTNVTVLELAATIDFLWRSEKIVDWRSEVEKRKRAKIGGDRLERAIELLRSLGLTPPEAGIASADD
jgi:uncharacterized protein YwgA